MKVSEVSWGVALLLGSVGAWAEGQPVCRWLDLDDTRIFQCAVLPEVAEKTVPAANDGLPDPTRPLTEQMASNHRQEPANLAELIPNKERFKNDFVRSTLAQQPVATETPEVAAVEPAFAADSETSKQALAVAPQLQASPEAQHGLKQPVQAARYLVLAQGETEQLKQRLHRENVKDFAYLPSRQRLSLGLYSSRANATRRLEALQQIGIDAEIEQLGGQSGQVAKVDAPTQKMPEEAKREQLVTEPVQQTLQPKLSEYVQLAIANVPDTEVKLVKVSADNATDRKPQTIDAVNGYIVASLGDTEKVLETLRSLSTNDYVPLRRGPYQGRVSVGVYSSLENAYARQAFMQQQGIDTEVIARDEQQVIRTTLPALSYPQIALIPLDV